MPVLTPVEALKKHFGHQQFRDGQERTVDRILQGQHTLLVMPTGSGKSLTYQLPALMLPGLTLVLSPLIALMKDQVDSLVAGDIPATYINSSLPSSEAKRRTRAMLQGEIKLLYVAPERLRNRAFTRALANIKISLLAVDEAHCISQWGHDFRPDYLHIGPIWQAMGQPVLLATTATATPSVQTDIKQLLGLNNVQTIVTGFNRPNLTFGVTFTPDVRSKLQRLQACLDHLDGSAIVYCATRRNTEEVAEFIDNALDLPARAYHGGLERDTRHTIQNDFMADRVKVVVATNAFGMGVDKPDVRAVIHYNMPATVEAYYQEAGRSGRDGQLASCDLLFAPDDYRLQQWLINNDTPTRDDLHQLYARLSTGATAGEVYFALNELAQLTGLHPVKVRVALSELEQAGALYHLGDQGGYSQWKVHPLSDNALEERARAINKRAKVRFELLDRMLDYVHLTTCRRQFLLRYFGDTSPAEAPHCCDNHATTAVADLPKAETPQEWAPLIVLETIRSYERRPLGRSRLSQLLAGSRAKGIEQFGYDRHKFYGKLGHLSQAQIIKLVDSLISARYVRQSRDKLPVLTLTEAGLDALNARAALPMPDPDTLGRDNHTLQRPGRHDRPNTVLTTLAFLEQGLTPTEIAAQRSLTAQTIYGHLARLIADSTIELHQVISTEVETHVLEAVKSVGGAGRLTPIKAALPEAISFGDIKCVLAAHPELVGPGPASSEAEMPGRTQPNITPGAPNPSQPPPDSGPSSLADANAEPPPNPELLETLRAWRTEQARAQRVPPYIIFSNRVLAAIASRRPTTLEALGQLKGIGPAKLEQYGQAVIELVRSEKPVDSENGEAPETGMSSNRAGVNEGSQDYAAPSESESDGSSAHPAQDPNEVILAVVADLDGLITVDSLARLLTAGPQEVVSFGDHRLFGAFHPELSRDDVSSQIRALLQGGHLSLSAQQRLTLPFTAG